MASSQFEEECRKYFGSSCLYAVLGLERSKNVTSTQVRRAYYNAAVVFHPNRCEGIGKSKARAKFQLVSRAFAVLGNDEKRDMYFRTGRIDESDFCEEKSWIKHWRYYYKEANDYILKPFASIYRGSNEETQDVKKAYVKYKGDMDCIMESLIMSEIEDEPRYRRIIDRLIEAGEVELYDDYANEPAEKAKSRRERWMRESKELQKRCAVGNTGTNFPSLPEFFNAQKRECNSGIFNLLLEKYRNTEQQEEVSERPTSSKAAWKIEDQPKLVKQQSEKRVKLGAPEAKTNMKKGWPHKVSKEKEGRRAEEKDEEKNYAGNVMRTRYRERLAQKLLEEQQSPQLRSKEKVSARSNVVNGIGERTQRKRGRSSNKRRKKSEHKRDVPTNQQTKSKAVGRGRKTVQKRRGKEKKESIDKQQSTRKAELQDRKYGNSNGGKNMKLANSKKRRIKNAKTSLTTRKERGKSMRATDEDANDKSKHSGKFEKAEGSKPSKSSRRSKRKRRWFRSR